MIQIGGRHLWLAFLFMDFFRKYLKYNTVYYIIVRMISGFKKLQKLIGGNNNEVRKISINWGVNF